MQRNYKIDFLRALGTFLVILAHVEIPKMILEIRDFDVIMLVFISGISFAYSKKCSYKKYLTKRIKRLIIPTYVMMMFVFISGNLACMIMSKEYIYPSSKIIKSFMFLDDGIGYIWIAKVYIIVALLTPLLIKINNKIKEEKNFIIMIFILLLLSHFINSNELINSNAILSSYVIYIIPYASVFIIGMRYKDSKEKLSNPLIIISIAYLIISTCILGKFEPSSYKYPPDIYYIVYGIFVTCVLIKFTPNIKNKFIEYISKNSFTIYLIHIPCLLVYNMLFEKNVNGLVGNWLFKYCVILTGSIVLTVFINLMKEKWREYEN